MLTALLPAAPQLATLSEVNAALHDEYALRRRMLIERVGVTLKSFLWSNRLGETVREGGGVGKP